MKTPCQGPIPRHRACQQGPGARCRETRFHGLRLRPCLDRRPERRRSGPSASGRRRGQGVPRGGERSQDRPAATRAACLRTCRQSAIEESSTRIDELTAAGDHDGAGHLAPDLLHRRSAREQHTAPDRCTDRTGLETGARALPGLFLIRDSIDRAAHDGRPEWPVRGANRKFARKSSSVGSSLGR